MTRTTLMLSTALASMLLLAPGHVTDAEAAGIKIKPQIVKVKPRIAVAKPKLKVKVRAAKVRIKPKIKLKVRAAKAKIRPRIKITPVKPKLTAKLKVQPEILPVFQIKPRVKPQLKVTSKLQVKQPHSIHDRPDWHRPNRRIRRSDKVVSLPTAVATPQPVQTVTLPTPAITQSHNQTNIKDAIQAARAAEAAKDVIALGKLRTSATPELGLATPETARQIPNNNDILDSMTKQPERGRHGVMNQDSLWSQGNAGGFGPNNFAGLPNTHGQAPANSKGSSAGDAATAFWGVTQGKIAAGMGGATGQREASRADIGPWVDDSSLVPGRQHRTDTIYYNDDSKTIIHTVRYPNGTMSTATRDIDSDGRVVRHEYEPSPTSSERPWVRVYNIPRDPDEPYKDNLLDKPGSSNPDKPKADATKLYDPDSGYTGPSPFPWIDEKNKANLSTLENGKTPGGLPPAPDDSQPTGWSSGTAMYSANDVLERYDEDSRNRGERFKKPKDLCFHSEC